MMKSLRCHLLPQPSSLLLSLILSLPLAALFSILWTRSQPCRTVHASTALHASTAPNASTALRCCGPGCRARLEAAEAAEAHYDKKYFDWQTRLGREKAASTDWNKLLGTRPTDAVADLGAGGGHILATLNVSKRVAVEVNSVARAAIAKDYPNVQAVMFPEMLRDNSFDLIFSTSAIEHFECPLTELREIARKVRVGGRIAVGIKNEGIRYAAGSKTNDINQHLYTWNAQLLFNLITSAGFRVTRIDPPLGAVVKRGAAWTKPDHFKSEDAFVYHWAHGVKEGGDV